MILRWILQCLVLGCLLIYVIGGMAMSAVPQISRFAAPAALIGVLILAFICRKDLAKSWVQAACFSLIGASWLWADSPQFGVLGAYFTAIAGSVLIFGSIRSRILSAEQCAVVLFLPFVVNFYAYLFDINYTFILNDVSEAAADTRFSGFVGHPSPFVTRLLSPMFLVVALSPWFQDRLRWRLLFAAAMLVVVFGLLSSGSKKLILIASPFAIMMILLTLKELLVSVPGTLALGISGLVLVAVLVVAGDRIGLHEILDTEVLKRVEQALTGGDESTIDRFSLLSVAPRLIAERPIFGHGLDQFAVVSGAGYYSHNNAVELLVNVGVVGFLLYYGLIVWTLIRLWARCNARTLVVVSVPALIALDMTGVTYSDRGGLVLVMGLFFRSIYGARA